MWKYLQKSQTMVVLQLNFQLFKTLKNIKCCCSTLTVSHLSTKNQQHGTYSSAQCQTQNFISKGSNIVKNQTANVVANVNEQIVTNTQGRLFAVVHVLGLQYKVTTEDILVIRSHWPPTIGDEIRLEKVLLVGSSNFTLIGTPILPLDQVSVYATVIEKTYTHSYPLFYFKQRKSFRKLNFFKDELTYLRINKIQLAEVNKLGDTDGFKDRIL